MRNLTEMNRKTAMAPVTIKNCNVTLGNMKSLETPVGMLLQIELLVIFTAFSLLFLFTSGSWRRCCNNGKFGFVIFMSYTLSTYILTYALGLMNDAPFHNELFPIWAVFLMLVLLGSAHSTCTYSLEDNQQWRSYNWQIQIKLIWVIVLIVLYFRRSRSSTMTPIVCLTLILLLKSDERARALMAVSRRSLEGSTKKLYDYTKEEHESRGEFVVNPVSMRGYKYLVSGDEGQVDYVVLAKRFFMKCLRKEAAPAPDEDRLTAEKVWKCGGTLLSSSGDPDNKLKDICLSYALFKLLRLTYAGYSMPQEAHMKTRHLLLKEDSYRRVFRIVEIESSRFFSIFFYTKHSIIFQPGWLLIKLMEFIYIVIGIWATTILLKHYKRPNNNCRLAAMPNGLSVDVLVTSVIIILFIIVEIMQFLFMGFSEWAKVVWICKYVQKKSWQENVRIERMIRAICGVHLLKPWERKLHQYSFLDACFYKPSRLLNNAIMAAYINQTRDGQRQSKPIQLHEEVKKAVFHALKSNYNTKLENGQVSLRKNDVSAKLSWACQLDTQTQVILVWHIATSFCEHQRPVRSNSPEWTNFLVATSLSKYLSYLVAFAPWLLPDRPLFVEYEFNQAIIEARNFFGKCKRVEDRIKDMERERNGSCTHEETIIKQGAWLGNQLINDIKDEKMIWTILADFWVELVLYVAPSDNAKAHLAHLARGGEFVTHLWALLFHAGIKRDHPTKPLNALERSDHF
ncbi:hypothetical protein ACJRO7_017569 [Eucalyptus globulus]|uniref:DUF4220 domain-containing protein n=1 Tax=Eucalyptus globulus TaxID=34317 RepID=A0ABD3KRH2_EUCGL